LIDLDPSRRQLAQQQPRPLDPVFAHFRIGGLIEILEKLPQGQEIDLDRHGMWTPRQRLQDLLADKGSQALHSMNMGVVIARREFDRPAQPLKDILELGRGRWGYGGMHRVLPEPCVSTIWVEAAS
jgi:hypothetical protein